MSGNEEATRQLRGRLVDELRVAGVLWDEQVAAAFQAVPRHLFLPQVDPAQSYRDRAFATKTDADGRSISSSSQPAIMAIMLQQLGVTPGQRVLEIGAGTGYNAALLARLVGETGAVVTVDLDADLVAGARQHLAACGVEGVTVGHGDGALGWPQAAPYDRIILTVGAWDLAPAWIEQLAPGGRLVLPLALGWVQRSIAFERSGDRLESVSVRPCGFMRLRGAFAGPETIQTLDGNPEVLVEVGRAGGLDTAALAGMLAQPGEDVRSGVVATLEDVWDGLGLWLAVHEPELGRLSATGAAAETGLVPALVAQSGMVGTGVLFGSRGCATLVRLDSGDGATAFELGVRPFGPDGGTLAARLARHLHAWSAAGRPTSDGLQVTAAPRGTASSDPGVVVVEKRHTRLDITWRPATG